VRERFEAEKGAHVALVETLENCTMAIDNVTTTFETCKMEVKMMLEKLKNETISPERLDGEIRRIASEKAKQIVEACVDAASDDAAKEACLESAEALAALATLTGRPLGSVKPEELRGLVRGGKSEEISQEFRGCMEEAATDEAMRACRGKDEFKDAVGEAFGKGRDEVKDSDVREFLEEGVEEEIWVLLETCSEEDKDACMMRAKEMLANVTGRPAEAITDDIIRKVLDDEMKSELGDRMAACMDEAVDDAAKESCLSLATEALGVGRERGEAPSRADVDKALKEAGEDKAKEVSKDCKESREVCMMRVREEAAKSMGKDPEDLSEMEVERLNMEGAKDAAKDAARGCAAARKEDASATCTEASEVFAEARKMPIRDDADKKRIEQELVKEMEKDAMKVCMEEADRAGYERCMQGMVEAAEVSEELFKGMDSDKKEHKEKRAKEDAAVEVLGENFQVCMEAAETEDAMKACRAEMEKGKGKAGLEEQMEDVLKKYQRSVVADAARACNSTMRKDCIDQAREELKKSGLKERAFGVIRSLAEYRAAAERWAACQEFSTTADNATCIALAEAEYADIAGGDDLWTEEVWAKVKELGEAMMEGREIFVRTLQAILIEALTDALECSDAALDAILEKINQTSEGFKPNASMGPRNITNKECKIVWGLARYKCKLDTEDLDVNETAELSDSVSGDLASTVISGGRRLGGRRLATVTDTYADQETEETTQTSGDDGDGNDNNGPDDGDDDGDDTGSTDASSSVLTVCGPRSLLAAFDLGMVMSVLEHHLA